MIELHYLGQVHALKLCRSEVNSAVVHYLRPYSAIAAAVKSLIEVKSVKDA